MPYHESVPSSRWFTLGVLAGAVVAVAFGAWLLRDEASRDDGGAIAGPVLIGTGVALALVARVFGTLRIDVDPSGLRARRSGRRAWSAIGGWRTVDGACATAGRAGG